MNCFVVIRWVFDGLENEIDAARIWNIEAVFTYKDTAEEYITDKSRNEKKYKGWDGREYPNYGIKMVPLRISA